MQGAGFCRLSHNTIYRGYGIAAARLPKMGGVFIQMEDEIASISAIIGGSLGGLKSMTATSGPVFSDAGGTWLCLYDRGAMCDSERNEERAVYRFSNRAEPV